jgi:hypothetical protein
VPRYRRRIAVAAVALLAVVGLGGATAGAQPSGTYVSDPLEEAQRPPPPEAGFRTPPGFVIGFDVGIGVLGGFCDECRSTLGGASLDLFSGALIGRRIAVLADLWSLMHLLPADSDERGVVAHTMATVGAQVWLTPALWVRGGIGAGLFSVMARGDDEHSMGPAAAVAVGNELQHLSGSSIDVSIRLGGGRHEYAGDPALLYDLSAQVGWHWF